MLEENSKRIKATFRGPSEFSAFIAGRPEACNLEQISHAADVIRQRGRALTPRFGWARTKVVGSNYREDIHIMGMPGRVHALLDVLDERTSGNRHADILWFDDATRLPREMYGAYPELICCTPDMRGAREGNPQQLRVDPSVMGFIDQSFEAIVFNENLHVQTELGGVFKECVRVLRPRGVLLATFPFDCVGEGAGTAPSSAYGGSNRRPPPVLGWEVVELAQRCGFADCCMVYISDPQRGILGADLDGIFVLVGHVGG